MFDFHFKFKYSLLILLIGLCGIGLLFFIYQVEVFAESPDLEDLGESSYVQPNYNRTDPIEPDWYRQNRENVGVCEYDQSNPSEISNISIFYIAVKNKTSWYLWKVHSKKYGSYKEFKKQAGHKGSISSDLRKIFRK